jgi:hypothetical protein
MTTGRYTVELDEKEWKLVSLLRDLPEGPLRERVRSVVDALVGFASDPKCNEVQGDGVPCGSVHSACDGCDEVTGILDEAAEKLRSRTLKLPTYK